MSNFQELQVDKRTWNLSTDEKLFEKLKFMQDNVIQSATCVHDSMNELGRAINAAHTTLYNSINAFNALNFNKFLENVTFISINQSIGCRRSCRSIEYALRTGRSKCYSW